MDRSVWDQLRSSMVPTPSMTHTLFKLTRIYIHILRYYTVQYNRGSYTLCTNTTYRL